MIIAWHIQFKNLKIFARSAYGYDLIMAGILSTVFKV